MTRKLPLEDFYHAKGYTSTSVNGINHFKTFTSLEKEYDTLYNGAGLFDRSAWTLLYLYGNDVLDYLHRISTNDLKSMGQYSVKKTIFTNEKGRILDVVSLYHLNTYILLAGSEHTEPFLSRWINRYVISDDVHIKSSYGEYIIFDLIGPQSDSFMVLLFSDQIKDMQNGQIKRVSLERAFFLVAKTAESSGASYTIISTPDHAKDLINYCTENAGVFQFNLIGSDAYDRYRIEQGLPGKNEITDQYNPHEIRLLDYVNFKKGCYIGQEVIARLDTYEKVQRSLSGVIFKETPQEQGLFTLYDHDNSEVGIITSLTYSPKGHSHIGLAYIKKNHSSVGSEIEAVSGPNRYPVTIKKLPFNF